MQLLLMRVIDPGCNRQKVLYRDPRTTSTNVSVLSLVLRPCNHSCTLECSQARLMSGSDGFSRWRRHKLTSAVIHCLPQLFHWNSLSTSARSLGRVSSDRYVKYMKFNLKLTFTKFPVTSALLMLDCADIHCEAKKLHPCSFCNNLIHLRSSIPIFTSSYGTWMYL